VAGPGVDVRKLGHMLRRPDVGGAKHDREVEFAHHAKIDVEAANPAALVEHAQPRQKPIVVNRAGLRSRRRSKRNDDPSAQRQQTKRPHHGTPPSRKAPHAAEYIVVTTALAKALAKVCVFGAAGDASRKSVDSGVTPSL